MRNHVDHQPIIGKAQIDVLDIEKIAHRASCAVSANHIARLHRCPFLSIAWVGKFECDMVFALIERDEFLPVMNPHMWRLFELAEHHRFKVRLIEHVHLRPAGQARAVPVDLEQRFEISVLKFVILARTDYRIEQWRKFGHQP